jgi:hypothetical protein
MTSLNLTALLEIAMISCSSGTKQYHKKCGLKKEDKKRP